MKLTQEKELLKGSNYEKSIQIENNGFGGGKCNEKRSTKERIRYPQMSEFSWFHFVYIDLLYMSTIFFVFVYWKKKY